ncbi:helix-turn-helix domain-containing protein [Nocardia sp. CA-107356]|uniref:helix-turn-helix domain-containing protein n=1 Tax=Nocardia sp. CA-107356 TaxID=3239972 RepID=UPI003D8B19A2
MPPIYQEALAPTGQSRYLREEDRIRIADLLREGTGVQAIASELCRAPSTISREIRCKPSPWIRRR